METSNFVKHFIIVIVSKRVHLAASYSEIIYRSAPSPCQGVLDM